MNEKRLHYEAGMRTYDDLKEEFEAKVEKLQERCKHPKTEWMEQWWAYGHFTGKQVKVCLVCNKILDKKDLE